MLIKNEKLYFILNILLLSFVITGCSTASSDSSSSSSSVNSSSNSSNSSTSQNNSSSNDSNTSGTPLIPLEPSKPVTPLIPLEPSKPVIPLTPLEPAIPNENIYDFDIKYDPFYPEQFNDTPYTLNVPVMDERFTLNEDKSIATLFAPGVTKDGGYYDVNKNFYNDNHLCWAASISNIVAWYLDRYEELNVNIDIELYERDVNKIFDNFRGNWNYMEGYDPLQGFAWYFTGNTLSGTKPDELLNPNSGGYLKKLPNVGDIWSIIDPVNHYPIVGNYSLKYPFIEDNLSLDTTALSFSKNIIRQLHFGPSSIMILPKGASTLGSHAITLWGCDYDTKSGMVKAIYITDSDDESTHPGSNLRRIKIKEEHGDHGVSMVDYWPSRGNPSPFLYVTAATNLYAPSVVKMKEQ